jgi:hypothetical protein
VTFLGTCLRIPLSDVGDDTHNVFFGFLVNLHTGIRQCNQILNLLVALIPKDV